MNGLKIKKILFITKVYSTGFGVGLVVKKQLEYLQNQGFENLHLASEDIHSISFSVAGVTQHQITPKKAEFTQFLHSLLPDIIIAHTPPYFHLVSICADESVYKIAYDHGEPDPSFFSFDQKEREEAIRKKEVALKFFNKHISISNFIKHESSVINSTTIYNGVDHFPKEFYANESSSIKDLLKVSHAARVIAALTRIGENEGMYKGYSILHEFKKLLKKSIPEEDLVFVIMGKAVPKGNQAELEFQKEGFHIIENISEEDKCKILAGCDLFISTSLWEGFNLPLTEAQYLGAPSICFSTGAHPEVCLNHFSTMKEAIGFAKKILKNENFKNSVSLTGKQWVSKQFTWERNGQNLLVELQNISHQSDRVIITKRSRKSESITKILSRDLARREKEGTIINHPLTGQPIVRYSFHKIKPLISILIPNHDHYSELKICIDSILTKSTWDNFEIIIIENGSKENNILEYYKHLESIEQIRIIKWSAEFNYSAVNNYGVRQAIGDYLVFLNNDTEIISEDWLERMYEYAAQEEIGAVGVKLLFPDQSIQHAGIVIGINGVAANMDVGKHRNESGYLDRLNYTQNVSAVTGACLMCRKKVFEQVGGFDESYPIALNDVDLCLMFGQTGLRNVWLPHVEVFHHEKKTRGDDTTVEKSQRFNKEIKYFKEKWGKIIRDGDPYYHRNLSKDTNDFSLKL